MHAGRSNLAIPFDQSASTYCVAVDFLQFGFHPALLLPLAQQISFVSVTLTLRPGHIDGEDLSILVLKHWTPSTPLFRQDESFKTTEVLREAPASQGAIILLLHEANTKVRPIMLERGGGLEVDVGEDVAHPAWHVEDVVECNGVAVLAATGLPSDIENDCTNTENRDLTLVGKGQDVRFEGSVSLEASMVCREVGVGRSREDPIIASSTVLVLSFLGGTHGLGTMTTRLTKYTSGS